MNDNRTALAAAIAGGYLLGRTKKAKLAFAVGSYLAGRRFGLSPGDLLSQGLSGLQQTPQVRELAEQVRGELLTAGRTAATAAANRRLTGLADVLRDRTEALTGESLRDDDQDEYEDDEYGDDRDEDARDEDARDEDDYFDEEEREEDREPAPRRRTAKKAPPRKSAAPAGKPARKAAPAKKATKKATGKTAKKAAKSPAKKTAKKAAPAKKTASSRRRGGERG
ncbi:hypothetical protein [Streptomyces parvulus]|uniref:hypothetical protein n=1 Tax=Streptomyces parvulus TaxID=146923 RepID=UPI00339F27F3